MNDVPFQIDKRAHQLRSLTEVSRALTYAVSLEEVLDLTVRRAAELLEAQRAVLMLSNEDGLLTVRASYGLDPASHAAFEEPLQETLIARLRALLDCDAENDFVAVPLVVAGEVTGLLAVALRTPGVQAEEEEWLLSALADQAAVALEKSRLDETAEFREKLIGIVSHDLRNPVAVILMAASVLAKWDQLDILTITKMISRIQSSAEKAAAMIRDLLDFTQARLGGSIPLARKSTDLHAIVRKVVDELEVAHTTRVFQVHHQGDAQGEWDADRLEQVVGNLLSNAVAYSPVNSIIRVATSSSGDGTVSLIVHNEGHPIAVEMLPILFEPMVRASADLSNTNRSVGLGLYIVKHIVDAHRGKITVRSDGLQGTTFEVSLPLRVE